MVIIRRFLSAFGRFWWEFLIGENPDAFIGTLLIVGAALLFRHERYVEDVLLPVLAVLVLVLSAYRGRQRV